jgi:glycosyl transferase family 25
LLTQAEGGVEAGRGTGGIAVDAVYVLSLPAYKDRIAHVTRELAARRIEFSFIFDFGPDDLDDRFIACRFQPASLARPHMSLVLKHMHAWRLACEHRHRRILVFEDDVLLGADFTPRLAEALHAASGIPPGWLIFLGGADTKVPAAFFRARGPLIANPIATAEGYVTDLAACERRLAWCATNRIALPADHLIRHIDQACGIEQYWLPSPIVEQGSVTGLFDSVLDANRKKHSWLYNWARYRWNKLQRRQIRSLWSRLWS